MTFVGQTGISFPIWLFRILETPPSSLNRGDPGYAPPRQYTEIRDKCGEATIGRPVAQ